MKMRSQIAGRENARHKTAGHQTSIHRILELIFILKIQKFTVHKQKQYNVHAISPKRH